MPIPARVAPKTEGTRDTREVLPCSLVIGDFIWEAEQVLASVSHKTNTQHPGSRAGTSLVQGLGLRCAISR